MTSFLAGLALIAVGLVSALFGYRLFRILLPIFGGIVGFLTAWAVWGESMWLFALITGAVLALILWGLAYGLWSVLVGFAGVVAGLALAAIIATSLNMSGLLAVLLAAVLAVAFGYLFVKVRNPAVILITATVGAAAVARGVGEWFGLQAGFGAAVNTNPGWLLILMAAVFVIVGAFGLAFQWSRYRHHNLYGEPDASEAHAPAAAATRAASAPIPAAGAETAAAGATGAVAAPAAVAVAGAAAVAANKRAEPAVDVVVEAPAEAAAEVVEAPVAAVAIAEVAEGPVEEAVVEAPAEVAAEVVEAPVAAAALGVAVAEAAEGPVEEAAVEAQAEVAAEAVEAPAAALGVAVANKVEDIELAKDAAPSVVETPEAVDANTVDEIVKEIQETYSYDDIAKFKEKLEFVEGIGPAYAEKLVAVGIHTVLDLLHRGATRKGRLELVEATGISAKLILRWVNHADLYRIKGVGSEYADLLEMAGVDTVVELSKRNPANLFNAMTETNKVRKLVRKEPVASQVDDWVAQAKKLPRVIQY